MLCEYCNKELSSIVSLKNHKKTAKYCLKIQSEKGLLDNEDFEKKEINEFKEQCNFCEKYFSNKSNLKNHLKQICCVDLYKINTLFGKQKELEKDILECKRENMILTSVNTILEGDHQCLKEIANQPKIITNNTTNNTTNKILNVVSPLDLNDHNYIKQIITNHYKLDYIFAGQKGLAQFAIENILKDENGNLKYICTDPSRQIFKYKDVFGDIQKDVEAKKLTNYLVEGGITNKACDIAKEWWTDENGNTNSGKLEILLDKTESMIKLEDDNTIFKKELATITSI
jgi:hypothetical protein